MIWFPLERLPSDYRICTSSRRSQQVLSTGIAIMYFNANRRWCRAAWIVFLKKARTWTRWNVEFLSNQRKGVPVAEILESCTFAVNRRRPRPNWGVGKTSRKKDHNRSTRMTGVIVHPENKQQKTKRYGAVTTLVLSYHDTLALQGKKWETSFQMIGLAHLW